MSSAYSEYIANKRNKFFKFLSEAKVKEEYVETHKGFLIALQNDFIGINYFHMCMNGIPTFMLPCKITEKSTPTDYFLEGDAKKFVLYVEMLRNMMCTDKYQTELIRLLQSNSNKINIQS